MLPNFIIVGAPKAGTTSLYHYLTEHPQVFMSDPKEVNFFSRKEIEAQGLFYDDFKARNLNEYEELFASVTDEKAVGEASVSYLFYPEVPAKIKETLPNVKIIILLRDPVDRGFSHYLMDYKLGLVDIPFKEIIYKTNKHKNQNLYYQQYVELGLYYEQVKRYLDIFGHEKVRIYFQEDLRSDSKKTILDLYEFLGIDKSFMPNIEREHNVFAMPKNKLIRTFYAFYPLRSLLSAIIPKALKEKIESIIFERKQKPKLEQDAKAYLWDFYRDNICELEHLLDRDLSQWYENINTENVSQLKSS